MPEGDTVYRIATVLHDALAGELLTRTDFRVPAFATVDLAGSVVHSVVSRGKHLLIRAGEYSIHSHLKMEGTWRVYRPGQRWSAPTFQARAVLETEDHVAVGFQLGLLEVLPSTQEHEAVGYLGPDPLGPDWDADEALRRLVADPNRPVGLAVIDQRVIAGLGNVLRNELCFLNGVLPTRPVGEVARPERLVDLAFRLLQSNKLRVRRTTTGQLFGQTAWVHDRADEPCLRCGTRILRGELGESPLAMRNTFWCPHCQR